MKGSGNWLVALMLEVASIAFSRLTQYKVLILVPALILLLTRGLLAEKGAGAGGAGHPPLAKTYCPWRRFGRLR